MENVYIKPPFIKLDQFLKLTGVAFSGGEAKEMILDEEVLVNGEVCLLRGKKLYENDIVKVFEKEYKVLFKNS